MNTLRSILLGAGALIAVTMPALAYDRSFAVTNTGRYDIVYVYATAASARYWGDDLLGDDVIEPGDTEWVEPYDYTNRCTFDVRIDFDNGAEVIVPSADLCSITEIRTNGNTYRLLY